MRPTRRGLAAIGVVGFAVFVVLVSGRRVTGGPGPLNALAAPVLVALVAAVVQVYRAGEPTVERTVSARGFPGETRTVELSVEGSGVARFRDRLPDGVAADATFVRSLPATVEYDLALEARGVHVVETTAVAVRDALGLVEARYAVATETEVVVYPPVYTVADHGPFLQTLGTESEERTEFDRLREYVPGDALRDIHWKSSAKHDDLLVTEYTDPTSGEGLAVAAEAARGAADDMAAAAATVVVAALRAGLSVELTVPDGHLPEGYGEIHREHALELLARTGDGQVADHARETADVFLAADGDDVHVRIGRDQYGIDDLAATRDNPLLAPEVASA